MTDGQRSAEDTVVRLLLLLGLFVVLGMAATIYVARLRDTVAQLALEKSNAAAAQDTTRHVKAPWLGDSLQLLQRLTIQRTQERDSVDRLLGQTRVAKLALQVTVDSLRVQHVASTSPVQVDTAGDRSADFHVRQVPYTADAHVILPASGAGHLDLAVHVDSAGIRARLGCGAAVDGIRAAQVTLETPAWLRTAITTTEQDPALCNAQLGKTGAQHVRPSLSLGPAYSLVHLPDGTWRSGWGFSGQLSLIHWP